MKMADVVVGGRYTAKVGGRLTTVRVVELRLVPPPPSSVRTSWRRVICAVNEATGRRATFRSPRQLLVRKEY